jgi:hypothetical protein
MCGFIYKRQKQKHPYCLPKKSPTFAPVIGSGMLPAVRIKREPGVIPGLSRSCKFRESYYDSQLFNLQTTSPGKKGREGVEQKKRARRPAVTSLFIGFRGRSW